VSIEEFTHSLAEYINADTPADHTQAIRDFAAACRRYDEDPRERQRICGIADLIKAEDANYAQALAALHRSDHNAALPLLREAAKEGIGEAAWLLAGLLEQKGDLAGAITWYQRAADDGDSRASDKLTDMHSQSATADNAIEALPGPDYLAGTESGHMKHIDRPASSTERALTLDKEPKDNHRGGGRPGPRRLLIPAAILTEAGMAYVAMEAPIGSQRLAIGLAMLAALIGAAATCILANRRFSRFPVLATRRIPKGRMTLAAIAAAAAVAMVATAVLITRPAGGALLSHMHTAANSSSPASPAYVESRPSAPAPAPAPATPLAPTPVPPHPAVVLFEPDSEVFADKSTAIDALTPIADWLAANPSERASLDGVSGDIELFRQRAAAVREELIALGANAAQITTEVDQSPSAAKIDAVTITTSMSS
jgi:outer membrane protein OmpA-like peptidoglycan-associated protein